MASTIDRVLFAVPLDYPMFAELDALEVGYSVNLARGQAVLELPRLGKESERAVLVPPLSAVERLASKVEVWGELLPSGKHPIAEIRAVLFRVACSVEVDWDVSTDQVGGKDVAHLGEEIHTWLDSFITWIWGLTSQSLDKNHPDPKMFHRNSTHMVQVATAGDQSSYPAIVTPSIPVVADFDGSPSSERAVNQDVVDRAAARAGSAPPTIIELLASARMFCRRGDRRRAIIDTGAVAEAALTQLSTSPLSGKETLGELIKTSPIAPTDAKTNLVDPRNDAVHRSISPSVAITNRAIEIAEELAAEAEPDVIRAASLRYFWRPARLDLSFIRPPGADGVS